jgi:hypothetical protein
MFASFQISSIVNTFVRIFAYLLLIVAITTCLSNNKNVPSAIENQIGSKLNFVEPLPLPQANVNDNFEGSGINPDDEDGDVEEGSGDDIEGSGSPPLDDNVRITTQTIVDNVEEMRRKNNAEFTGISNQFDNGTIGSSISSIRTHKPDTTIKTEQTSFSGSRVDMTKESSSTFSTIKTSTKNKEIKSTNATTLGKTDKERFPPEFVPPIPTTTRRPATTSTVKTTLKTTVSTTKSTKLPKQKMPPPPFIVDPTGTLEQLKPGVFALIVGGAVVFVLLMILVITYIFYRIRKKDEGSYICEDHVQTHRYSNYYQKASTKEFYA